FADALTQMNGQLGGKLVPCVKLVKGIVATLPDRQQLTGYHVEALAMKVFAGYEGAMTPKAMVRHFFEQAPEQVRRPIRDRSGQSMYVDSYLGDTVSLRRRIVADGVDRVRRRISNADASGSVDRWEELFE
ncbi:MAG: nucleotidyltransferase, partial [Chloroflexota bacterium]|nr:nucleotidyltransferase [Chloroflexota bacterium]